jgi:hypothetical protein
MAIPLEFVPYIGEPAPLHEPGGWEEYEESLGRGLPAEYKSLLDAFGAGILNRALMIGHPRSIELNLSEMLSIQSDQLEYLRSLDGEPDWLPYPVSPEANAMHMWGYSDVGDLGFLVPKAKHWAVGIWMREGEWHEVDADFSDWLIRELREQAGPASLLAHLRRGPAVYAACR